MNNNELEKNYSPMESSPTWVIESAMLDIYWFLAHRIKGLGWSLDDFWKVDTWTTSHLYCRELELAEQEPKDFDKKPHPEEENSPEMDMLYEEMFGYEDEI